METIRPARAAGPPPPRPRAVLLGASNLRNGLPAAVGAARRTLGGGPIDVLVAAGHGRSYGSWSRVAAMRGLPGILDCGLWRALGAGGSGEPAEPGSPTSPAGGGGPSGDEGSPPTVALITDVGNDVGYGERPETVAEWIAECAGRLAGAGATTVVSRLPLATLRRLPRWRFRVVATLLFPTRRLDFDTVLGRAEALDRRLDELAGRCGFQLVGLEPGWYRDWDAIHLRFRDMEAAWGTLFGAVDEGRSERGAGASLSRVERLRIHLAPAERFTFAGIELRTAQPAVRLADGSTVRLF